MACYEIINTFLNYKFISIYYFREDIRLTSTGRVIRYPSKYEDTQAKFKKPVQKKPEASVK